MAKKNDRFVKTYSQGTIHINEIWVDRDTGVNYLYSGSSYGNSAGLTVLLDKDGKPIISSVEQYLNR